MIYLTLEEILILHKLQIEKFGGSLGIRDIRLLESAIYRPHTTFGGVELYPDIFTKAASLAHTIMLLSTVTKDQISMPQLLF